MIASGASILCLTVVFAGYFVVRKRKEQSVIGKGTDSQWDTYTEESTGRLYRHDRKTGHTEYLPWQRHVDPTSGKYYWTNSNTGESVWNDPSTSTASTNVMNALITANIPYSYDGTYDGSFAQTYAASPQTYATSPQTQYGEALA